MQVQLRDAQAQVVATLITHSVESQSIPATAKLVFLVNDGGHHLKQIWLAGSRVGYELPPSKAAVTLARHRSSGQPSGRAGGNRP